MVVYIPENLDLEKLEEQTRPDLKIKHYKRDKMAYLLHLLNYIRANDKRLLYKDKFVSFQSVLLQKQGIINYKHYLNLLKDNGIIVCDDHYINGEKSKGYKLTGKYSSGIKPYQVQDFTFMKRLELIFLSLQKGRSKYLNLKKWFSPKLKIDSETIREFLWEEYQIKEACPYLQDRDRDGIKDPETQYNSACINLLRYESQQYDFFTVDEFGNRFHSLLSNTRSMMRNALTYDGKQLASLDISNSQPYFSTLLFKKAFWESAYQNKKFKSIIDTILHNNNIPSLSVMLSTIEECLDKPDVQRYIDLVVSGKFYDVFEEEYFKATGLRHNNRDEIKSEMFLVLFSRNSYIHTEGTEGKDLFENLFPNVYRLFKMIKRKEKELLPKLLQRIESDIILDDICEVITFVSNMPIFPIHDCIATTTENIPTLREIMLHRLQERVGSVPKLKEEVWCIDNINQSLSELKAAI